MSMLAIPQECPFYLKAITSVEHLVRPFHLTIKRAITYLHCTMCLPKSTRFTNTKKLNRNIEILNMKKYKNTKYKEL